MEKLVDDITITLLKGHRNCFLKFDYVIICLENTIWPNHATSGNQNRRLK